MLRSSSHLHQAGYLTIRAPSVRLPLRNAYRARQYRPCDLLTLNIERNKPGETRA